MKFSHLSLTPRIPPVVAESFSSNESDGGKLQALKDHLDKFNTQFASHFGPYTTQTSVNPTGGSNPSPARTHCRPAFADGDRPLDFTKTLLPAVAKPIADFDSAFELLGKDSLILESSVRMAYILSNFNSPIIGRLGFWEKHHRLSILDFMWPLSRPTSLYGF